MRAIKLIPGKMNIPYIKCKVGYAEGAKRPKRVKKIVEPVPFNPIIIRKAA